MKRLLVVDRDFFTGPDVSQSEEHHVTVQRSHEGIRLAGVIDVVRAVAAPRAVQAETPVDVADAQDLTIACAPASFEIRDALAGVLSYLPPPFEISGSKTPFAVNRRLADCEAVREFHRLALYDEISPQRSQRKTDQLQLHPPLRSGFFLCVLCGSHRLTCSPTVARRSALRQSPRAPPACRWRDDR